MFEFFRWSVSRGGPLVGVITYNADLLDATKGTKDLALGFIDDIVYGTEGPTDKSNITKIK